MVNHKASKEATRQALRAYLKEAFRYKRFIIPGLILPGIGLILVFYVPPLIIAQLLEHFSGRPLILRETLPFIALFGAVWLAGEILWRIAFYCLEELEARGVSNMYKSALDQLFSRDIHFFHDNFAGSLTKKTVAYAKSFENFIDALAFNVFAQVIPLIFVSVVLWRFSPYLALVLFGLIIIVCAIIIPRIRKRKLLVETREAASNHTAGYVADIIGNIDAVQAYAHEDHERAEHHKNVDDYAKKALRSWHFHTLRIDGLISPIYVMINVIGLTLAIVLSNDVASITKIFITFNYYAYATRVLWEFNRIYRNLENSIAEAAQFTELFLNTPKIQEQPGATSLELKNGEIGFQNVTFAYGKKRHERLFENFNLKIHAGEKLALVGPSGGGKSTVTKMLLRFVDVSKGVLAIDGQDVRSVTLKSLRRSIAFVPQEPIMFHRSIRENIRYGRLDATDQDVIEAAKKAHAHDFISGLANGYDTLVGERGVKLSGGQRQRIAIARAIIKDAPILVLDEATSALDSESEKQIQEALSELMKGRTAVVIAHRLSTIQRMDRIIVLEKGGLSEQGTHAELLAQKGRYAKLWAHQSGGFIED